MVHWPFELAFKNAVETGQDTVNQKLLTGDRLSDFVIADIEADSMTIRHPYLGVMGVRVNGNGNLMCHDAGLTTRVIGTAKAPVLTRFTPEPGHRRNDVKQQQDDL